MREGFDNNNQQRAAFSGRPFFLLLVQVIQPAKSPATLRAHKGIDDYLIAGGVLAPDCKLFWPGCIALGFSVSKAHRSIAFMIEDVAVALDELCFVPDASVSIRHRDGKLRELRDGGFVFLDYCSPELLPEHFPRGAGLGVGRHR